MIKRELIATLSARLREIVATSPTHDVEKNMRALLSSTFARFSLVTRDEFETQITVLARTRAKLEALEKQVATLEEKIARGN